MELEKIFDARLDLQLKGSRDYLHGTDIFEELVKIARNAAGCDGATDFDIAFHSPAHTGLSIQRRMPETGAYAVLFSFLAGKARQKLYLVEDARPIDVRRPFPEDDIVAAAEISKSGPEHCAHAVLNVLFQFTPIECWIAMVKALHLYEFPERNGRWLFTRGRFSRYGDFIGASKYRITLENAVGESFTRSSVHVDGERVGDIFFSLMNQEQP